MNQIKWPDEPAAFAGRQAGRVRSRRPDLRRPDRRRRAARPSRTAGSTASNPVWSKDGARAVLPLRPRGQEEPALETAADFLRRGDAGHDVRARHRRARLSRLTNRACCCPFKGTVDRKRARRSGAATATDEARALCHHPAPLQGRCGRRLSHRRPRRASLRLRPASRRQLRQITSGEYSESEAALVARRPLASCSSAIAKTNPTRATRPISGSSPRTTRIAARALAPPDERRLGEERHRLCSPDGRTIAFLTAEDGVYGIQQVAVIAASGGDAADPHRGRSIAGSTSSASRRTAQWIYFTYEQRRRRRHRVACASQDGKLETVLEGERSASSAFDIATQRRHRGAHREHERSRPEIYSLHARTAAPVDATSTTRSCARVALGSKEKVEFKSADGTKVEAFVTKPPGFVAGRKYPTILHIHGGPVGQFAYGFDFKPPVLRGERLCRRRAESARLHRPRAGFHSRDLPDLGHHGLRRRHRRRRPRRRSSAMPTRTGSRLRAIPTAAT